MRRSLVGSEMCIRDRLRSDSTAVFQADITDTDEANSLIHDFNSWAGGIDLLINNASSFYPTPIGTITDDQ